MKVDIPTTAIGETHDKLTVQLPLSKGHPGQNIGFHLFFLIQPFVCQFLFELFEINQL